MFLLVGLGNPGKEYEKTRHNIGFEAIDKISYEYNIPMKRERFKGVFGEGHISNEKVMLLKPTTYMNLSGESLREIINYYNIPIGNVIVIYDDVDLEVGRLRIRTKGSAGGHNGIKSIIHNLNSEEFIRVRIGVGKPERDMVSHVLGKFPKEKQKNIEEVLNIIPELAYTMISQGPQEAMNKYNNFKA